MSPEPEFSPSLACLALGPQPAMWEAKPFVMNMGEGLRQGKGGVSLTLSTFWNEICKWCHALSETSLALIPNPGALLDNSAILNSRDMSPRTLPHRQHCHILCHCPGGPECWGQDRHLPTPRVPCWVPRLSDIHKPPGAKPRGGRCPLQDAQVPLAHRALSGAGAGPSAGGDDTACYLQILLWLRLRGLQLDERSGGLGDHFLQQVIIWAKSGTCQAQLTGSACSLCPHPPLPGQPWYFVQQQHELPSPLVDSGLGVVGANCVVQWSFLG